jgi:zinc transporter ZupT
VTALLRGEHHHHSHGPVDSQPKTNTNSVSQSSNQKSAANNSSTAQDAIAPCACCSEDPLKDLETLKNMADEMERDNTEEVKREELDFEHGHSHEHNDHCVDDDDDEPKTGGDQIVEQSVQGSDDGREQRHKEEEAKLMRMSINTALAIGLHNFPEGLATFVATLNDPEVGVVLAIAIAIHNIPEGLCVAMPIYYATGNRRKAFLWACLSGASEPFAALLGWAVLANSFSNQMYAILFGLVAGMMVIISTRELLPTAHRYDPEDSVVTYSFIAGMAIMALSLVLFLI